MAYGTAADVYMHPEEKCGSETQGNKTQGNLNTKQKCSSQVRIEP